MDKQAQDQPEMVEVDYWKAFLAHSAAGNLLKGVLQFKVAQVKADLVEEKETYQLFRLQGRAQELDDLLDALNMVWPPDGLLEEE